MLEGVTFAQVVELVVEMLVNLSRGTVFGEETAEDAEATHPEDLSVRRRGRLAHGTLGGLEARIRRCLRSAVRRWARLL